MVYRDWLVALAPSVASYVQRLCQRRYQEMADQIAGLYALAREVGADAFCRLVEQALAHDAIGVEYLRAQPPAGAPAAAESSRLALRLVGPSQQEVERDLASYEAYIANRVGALVAAGAEQ